MDELMMSNSQPMMTDAEADSIIDGDVSDVDDESLASQELQDEQTKDNVINKKTPRRIMICKSLVIAVLIVGATVAALVTYNFTTLQETKEFENQVRTLDRPWLWKSNTNLPSYVSCSFCNQVLRLR
jgi:hypothetical protein